MEDLSGLPFKEIVKRIRKELKEEFPELKFSVRQEHSGYMPSLYVSLMEAPWDILEEPSKHHYIYLFLNPFALQKEWTKRDAVYERNGVITQQAWNVMKRATEIVEKYQKIHNDAINYYDQNFYFYPEIGQWNKPFKKV